MENKKGFIVCSRNGKGKIYFFKTEKEAWEDVNKNHPKYSIYEGEIGMRDGTDMYICSKLIKR